MPLPLRVTYLLDGFARGGTELNLVRVLEALARRGIALDVLHLQRDGELRQRIMDAGHRLQHIPLVGLASLSMLGTVARIARAVSHSSARVLHTQDVYSNILGTPAARLTGRRVITSRRWLDSIPTPGLAPLNRISHQASHLVLTNATAVGRRLVEEGVPAANVRVNSNFLDHAATSLLSTDARAAWRQHLGIPVGATVIGVVARLVPVKRHDVLLASVAPLLQADPSRRLVLVGAGPEHDAIAQRAIALDIGDRVQFTGSLPHQPFPHQLFDIVALTSESEASPNALVEAAACGVPVVATAVGGVNEVVREGETGLTVPAGDVAAIRGALERLLLDAPLRRQMGATARAHALAQFGEDSAIDRLLAVYRELGA